jgi:ABC-type Na+ transport system ATPase subunit NatA
MSVGKDHGLAILKPVDLRQFRGALDAERVSLSEGIRAILGARLYHSCDAAEGLALVDVRFLMTAGALQPDRAVAPGPEAARDDAVPLALRGVVRRWGKKTVLKGATLTLEPGVVAWLGGENGAGKTTLLRVAVGLIFPHGGTVRLFGLDPDGDRRLYQRRLGYLSAGNGGLYARLTVEQNLELWAGLAMVAPRQRAATIHAAIERFGLEELRARRLDRLSMGQRQRVRVAMVFLHEPDVVLLDEPHTSLDDHGLALLDAALAEVTARGGAALWCSPAGQSLPLRADVRFELQDGLVIGA